MESRHISRQPDKNRTKKRGHAKKASSTSFSSAASTISEVSARSDTESTFYDSDEEEVGEDGGEEEEPTPARENPIITERQPEFHRYTNRAPEQAEAWRAYRPYSRVSKPKERVPKKQDEGAACTRREDYSIKAPMSRTECI